MPDLASVNGRITEVADAVVPIDDRGFQFGDAVYEALRVYAGRPFTLDLHQERLRRSLGELSIEGVDIDALTRTILDLIERSTLRDGVVYYQVTRGIMPREHAPRSGLSPTIVVTVRAIDKDKAKAIDYGSGVSAITAPDIRWGRVDIKTTNLLPNMLARWRARQAGCYEAILFASASGNENENEKQSAIVREACGASVAIVRGGALIAPKHGPFILPGITRRVAEDLCRRHGIPIEERDFTLGELFTADEVILMGSSTEIVGAVKVDGRPIGAGAVGPTAKRLHALYRAFIAESVGVDPAAIG